MRTFVAYLLLCQGILSASPLTYDACAARVFTASSSLKKQELQVAMQEAFELQAGLWSNPSLEIEVGNFGGNKKRYRNWNQAASTYTLSQPIPVYGRIAAQKCVAAWATSIALWDFEIERQDLLLSLRTSCIDLAESQELKNIAEERLKEAETAATSKKTHLGQKKAQLAILNSKLALAKAAKTVEVNQRALALVWGESCVDFDSLDYPLFELQSPNCVEVYEEALLYAPALNRSTSLYYAALAAASLEDARRMGDVEIGGGATTWHCASERSYFVEFTMPLPLFDRNQGNRAAAEYAAWQALYQKEQIAIDLKNHLNTLYAKWKQAHAEATEWSQTALALAEEVLQAAQEEPVDPDDLADARSALLDAREDAVHAAAEAQRRQAEFQHLLGQD